MNNVIEIYKENWELLNSSYVSRYVDILKILDSRKFSETLQNRAKVIQTIVEDYLPEQLLTVVVTEDCVYKKHKYTGFHKIFPKLKVKNSFFYNDEVNRPILRTVYALTKIEILQSRLIKSIANIDLWENNPPIPPKINISFISIISDDIVVELFDGFDMNIYFKNYNEKEMFNKYLTTLDINT